MEKIIICILTLFMSAAMVSCEENSESNKYETTVDTDFEKSEKNNELKIGDESYFSTDSSTETYANTTELTYENVVQLVLSSCYNNDYASFYNLIPPASRRYSELNGMDDYEDVFRFMCGDFEENGVYGDPYDFYVMPNNKDIDNVYDTYVYLDEICGDEYSDYASGKIDEIFEISFSMKSNVDDIVYVNYGCYIVVQNGVPYFEYCENSVCSPVYEDSESSAVYEDEEVSTLFDNSLLKTANSNAKTAFNAINFEISKMETTGYGIADGLYFYDLSEVADDVICRAISESIDSGMVCYSIDNGELSFVQWKDSNYEKYIGQYPEMPDMNTNVTWGVFSKD
ncbi:MAG: hypothetical protein Q4E74_00925 [Ruminococcus sp.]|nr:hypothetical protein [Ruminococcus sp.]